MGNNLEDAVLWNISKTRHCSTVLREVYAKIYSLTEKHRPDTLVYCGQIYQWTGSKVLNQRKRLGIRGVEFRE